VHNEHTSEDPVFNWHVQDFTLGVWSLVAERGMAPGLGLEVTVPIREVRSRVHFENAVRRPFVPPVPDLHHRNETLLGPGDPRLLLHLGRSYGALDLGLRAGASLPLGSTEENPFELGRRGIPHQHVQFGTGTWDPTFGIAIGSRLGATSLEVSALARWSLYDNAHGYRAGARYSLGARVNHPLISSWFGFGGLDLGREEAETWDGKIEAEGNLGRTDLLAAFGLGRPVGAVGSFSLTVEIPLVTDATGAQVDYPVLISLGWSR
jgi:hypothetical protein